MMIVLASNNTGKLAELRELLPDWVEVVSAAELGVELPEETGTTFEENAYLKARTVASATDQIAVADDSGLEVDALKGAPGVRSARFAGEPSDDGKNNSLLLERLDGIDLPDRSARFRSVVAVVGPRGEAFSAEGSIEGHLLLTPRGNGGFGYDPLFVPIGSTQTLAELSLDRKNQISHRAVAFRGVVNKLLTLLETYQP
ncbi:MAG TPA: RdgB/HAM1 family non-canonical purine NTP pyrophosphatase [Nitrolancea sp.]|jgi:XTP/dITP diphosphohydrolase|nr:RdgB/HAM1 family non-canonical purine NTP pyrophosphatase [Nitrolancea sp.]